MKSKESTDGRNQTGNQKESMNGQNALTKFVSNLWNQRESMDRQNATITQFMSNTWNQRESTDGQNVTITNVH